MNTSQIVTGADLSAATAVFETRADAQAAADAAMPRRIRHRPYAQASGWHWARSIACPACGAAAATDCQSTEDRPARGGLHSEREAAARAAGRAADRWIVCAPSNTILLRDGSMYDHARGRTVGR